MTKKAELSLLNQTHVIDEWTNVPTSILGSVSRRLHLQPNHPISITRKLIESRFPDYQHHNDLSPVVTVAQNFDSLGFPSDHPGRSKTDTYYINKSTVLRTHTSAHQADTFRANTSAGFTISADVYRRDAIDRSHYPIFHQMEGAMTWDRNALPKGKTLAQQVLEDVEKLPKHDLVVEDPNPPTHPERNPLQSPDHTEEEAAAIATHLKRSLELVVVEIFSRAKAAAAGGGGAGASSDPLKVRWIEAYFPFTSPSWELEILWQGDWLEVLGCGVVKQDILAHAGVPERLGWAFGLGLERIAMLLYEIPDIRLFWSEDPRFLNQFSDAGPLRRFVPFSKYPACYKDVSFWLPPSTPSVTMPMGETKPGTGAPNPAGGQSTTTTTTTTNTATTTTDPPPLHENDIMELVRSTAGDLAESVSLIDAFTHPKTARRSLCYRINYRSLERTLTNAEADALHRRIEVGLVREFGVELR
ncbi:phenylalanyl-tRNA synthetase alpha subunit, mitochondrial [Elasticomyces elasticus]|nr:phenylalanyl-tRNA synthetase alpha subunit, mitochondrial [Elasticomyces elasticus]